MTAGTGIAGAAKNDIRHGLKRAVELSHPDELVFIASSSPDSQEVARSVEEFAKEQGVSLPARDGRMQAPAPVEADDFESIRVLIAKTFNSIVKVFGNTCEVVLNPTSGTKQMTAAAVHAALSIQPLVRRLEFIGGKRSGGTVEAGSEQLIPVELDKIFAERACRSALGFLGTFSFDATLEILEPYRGWKDAERLWLGASLLRAWDRFEWGEAQNQVSMLRGRGKRALIENGGSDAGKFVQACLMKAVAVADFSSLEFLIAEIVANAKRRLQQGAFEDCTARVYCAMEKLTEFALQAQDCLVKEQNGHVISIQKLTGRLEAKDISALREKDRKGNGMLELALVDKAKLLYRLEDDLGRKMIRTSVQSSDGLWVEEVFQKALSARNHSILAHGTRPVGRITAEKMLQLLEAYLSPHLLELARGREFPIFPASDTALDLSPLEETVRGGGEVYKWF